MTFLPVVHRHLRTLSRKWWTYWGRAFAGFSLVALTVMLLWDNRWRAAPSIAKDLFEGLSGTAFFAALLAGVVSTADSISSEKREGTLGLLFLTDLSGFDVVIGKLVSNGIVGLYMLAAGLPVMALPLMMGGVTGDQVLRMGVVIVNSMFFTLCVGLFVSVMVTKARSAVLWGIALVALITVGLVGGEAIAYHLLDLRYSEPITAPIGPLFGFLASLGVRGLGGLYWPSLLSTHLLAWAFLLAAAWKIRTAWQQKAPTVRQIKLRERLHLWSVGHAAERKGYRQQLLDINPVCWLDDRYRLQKSLLWGIFLAGLTFWMWMFSLFPSDVFDDDSVFPLIFLTQGALVIWMALMSCSRLSEDKASGALELLLSTPFSTDNIIRGRLLALRRQFGWVAVCLFTFQALIIAGMVYFTWRRWYTYSNYVFFMPSMAVCGLGVFALYLRSIATTGQWFAMVAPNGLTAAVGTLVIVVGLHWAMFAGLMMTWAMVDHYLFRLPRFGGDEEWVILPVWTALGVGNALFWSRWASRNLERHFRHIACRLPFRPNFVARLAKRFGFSGVSNPHG